VKALYRINEAGEALGFARSKTYQLIRRGELRVVHVDGVTRVPASAITDFVERLEAEVSPSSAA
jgi:excisionase family DNA binding protein